ncbi:DUF4399 domain-containing protein [Paraburkholderia fungorum]|jgi:hypothetical protein|uniref:DUF4399 domain-containing protein n=1 Tax=Paraburkholderia fungorum TaxID=134537 RepID=A0AAW3UQ22_9BURK|nr:DUF4399 domain-containing protein [Paraburkholderia fungorum]KFX66087.1 ATPase [Burkholderia sp. K24]MBB4513514.1 hypothetical protein [Paraburkholderia fungorum]MBB6200754.1 hypothetical protein [Paraburkholderia fungorum]USX05881.1 DUF4399 domain-containing protein [Paraburkholderia fungorum]
MDRIIALAALLAFAALTSLASPRLAVAGTTPSPAGAHAYIGYPNDGQVVAANKPFRVWFGLRYMGVAPKGVKYPNTGHHHLLIDTDLPPMDQEIPNDRNHLHFGAGETETMIQLPPGKHTLQLLMGDDMHVPHNPPVYSKKITVIAR